MQYLISLFLCLLDLFNERAQCVGVLLVESLSREWLDLVARFACGRRAGLQLVDLVWCQMPPDRSERSVKASSCNRDAADLEQGQIIGIHTFILTGSAYPRHTAASDRQIETATA
ncbi:MAG TPA: hypothetical protein VFD59_03685 [Nocardioidaceae bacterium]|nr:hypothetical protein [Nocardioidaceae bacterium]